MLYTSVRMETPTGTEAGLQEVIHAFLQQNRDVLAYLHQAVGAHRSE